MKDRLRHGKKINNILVYIFSFFLPIILFLALMYYNDFYPFGQRTLLVDDMNDQLVAFISSLRSLGKDGNSLFFSWSRSMGGNYLGLFCYYICNPLNQLIACFPVRMMPLGILILTVTKIGLSGLTFAILSVDMYCRRISPKSFSLLFIIPLSVSYAFISYNIYYSLFPMWMDGVILLPLVILGIDRLFDEKGGEGLYLCSMTASLILNYYTGYMVGIFSGLFFLSKLFSGIHRQNFKKLLRLTFRYFFFSILSIGIASPILMTVLRDLLVGRIDGSIHGFYVPYLYESFSEYLYELIHRNGEIPSFFIGLFPFIFTCAFFFLSGIKWREKLSAFCLILLFLASFYFSGLNLIWHCMAVPQGFHHRFEFLFSFLLLYLALRAFLVICSPENKMRIKKWISMIMQKSHLYGTITVCLVSLLTGIELLYNADKILDRREIVLEGYKLLDEYYGFIDETKPLVDYVNDTDKSFFRINQNYEYSKNDAMLLGYNGMTYYSSTYNRQVNYLTAQLGLAQLWMWNSGYGSNMALDSLFSVKYVLSRRPVAADYRFIRENMGATLYQNDTALGLIYTANLSEDTPNIYGNDPYENQNHFFQALDSNLYEKEQYWTEIPFQNASSGEEYSFSFTTDSANPVYLYLSEVESNPLWVYVNDVCLGNYYEYDTPYSLYLGNFTDGEAVEVTLLTSENQVIEPSALFLAQLDVKKIQTLLEILKKNTLSVTSMKNGKIEGNIYVPEGHSVITSIPYEKGWSVYVDGQRISYGKFADTFILFEPGEGQHVIFMRYIPRGIKEGVVICLLSCAAALIWFIRKSISYCKKDTLASIEKACYNK